VAEEIARAQGCSEVADLLSKLTSVSKHISVSKLASLSRACVIWRGQPSAKGVSSLAGQYGYVSLGRHLVK